MEQAKKSRAVKRRRFTKQFTLLEQYLEENKVLEARGCFTILEQYMRDLSDLDEKIFDGLLEHCTEEELEKESDACDEYLSKFGIIQVKVQDLQIRQNDQNSVVSSSNHSSSPGYNLRLPKVEIRKFSGELREWLPFWNQYQRIHNDDSIPAVDKFYYLDQAIVRNSRAWRILESFPPTELNYPLVIEALKERFGKEDLLIEVHIRDLLSLTLPSNKTLSLAELYDKLDGRLRALESLGVTKGKCASILCPLLESCMSEDFLRVWQRSHSESEVSSSEDRLEKLMFFMKNEVQNEVRIDVALRGFGDCDKKPETAKGYVAKHPKPAIPSALGLLTINEKKQRGKKSECIFCMDSRHSSPDCYKARDMSLPNRIAMAKNSKCCMVCLRVNHATESCFSKQKCPICDGLHVLILCDKFRREAVQVDGSDSHPQVPTAEEVLANLTSDHVLLPTLMVIIRGEGVQRMARAVLDTGSQRSYVLRQTASDMKCELVGEETVAHSLFGGQKSGLHKHGRYKLRLSSIDGSFLCNFDVLDQEAICGELPHVNGGLWSKELDALGLSRDHFSQGGPIEVLIGADVVGKLFTGCARKLPCGLTALQTSLGWSLLGRMPQEQQTVTKSMLVTSMLINDFNISDLWKLELIGITDPTESKSKGEIHEEVDQFLAQTLRMNSEGRYEVHLPWKENRDQLRSNYDIALRRLETLIKHLERDKLYDDYQQVLDEWLSEGVIEVVPDAEVTAVSHYLPHRHVVKENSTTRVRPVFDASAKRTGSPSLNDCLDKGKNILEQIPALLLRFRQKRVGVIADVRKAFLQISVVPGDRNCLRFLWRDRAGKLVIYRHRRVVFGVVCSPYHLQAVLRHHLNAALEKCEKGHTAYSHETINTLLNSFYVDNTVTSVDDYGQFQVLMSEARAVMMEGSFDLRGWEHSDPLLPTDAENRVANVLGLAWDKKEDNLSIGLGLLREIPEKITKRSILSVSHSLFDPIGFTCPVILGPKLQLRELWRTKCEWDDEVDEGVQDRFRKWRQDLSYLSEVKIRRWLPGTSEEGKWSVHVFCDSSESAYATAVFLRVETVEEVFVQLIQAKTRVAPIKRVTIPRLELLAALIGARLHHSIIDGLPEHCESYFWSDSTTALAWIKRNEQWAPFVKNRVNEIRQLTQPEQWNHVPGILNPADLPSRGCSGRQLLQSAWWEGPSWLKLQPDQWPACRVDYNESSIDKEKLKTETTMINHFSETLPANWYYKYFSKYEKVVRMVAWILRLAQNARISEFDHRVKRKGPLSVDEVKSGEITVLKLIQNEVFSGLMDPKIVCLQPFEDHDGVIRIKTRISNRPDSKDFRYPVLLPKGHPLVERLIMDMHLKECHVGTQSLLGILRERYWILGGRRAVRSVISRCVPCKRHQQKGLTTTTPSLPIDRVRSASAFEVTGVDVAGPMYLKNGKKVWICVYTCAVIRAIHLELLSSLSTEEFLQSFRRFTARRGRPHTVYSDNGTNFAGAANALCRVDWNKVLEYCSVERINWKFNPPTAAWWGGFFERMVGLMKRLLRRVLKRSSLNYVEMETLLCDCERVINSRPLTYISDDQNELSALTPAMFVQDLRESGVPDVNVLESSEFAKRFEYRARLRDDLQQRFRLEYLGQLRQAGSAHTSAIKIGDVVLVEHDNKKRLDWPLARVTELIPGKDGNVRLVKLQTACGELLRPIQRLYPVLEGELGPDLVKETEDDISSPDSSHPIVISSPDPDEEPTSGNPGPPITTRRGRTINAPRRFMD